MMTLKDAMEQPTCSWVRNDELERLVRALKKKDAKIEQLREALENLFEESEPRCDLAEQCFSSGRCGRGAYETPLENAAGGCWFSECSCMSEAQQNAAQLLDMLDRATLAGKEDV